MAVGYTLLRDLLNKDRGVSLMGIIAHEFGHIVQFFEQGVHDDLSKGESTVRLIELHADFLAGFYAGRRKASRRHLDADGLGDSFVAIGDYHAKHQKHHGTPQERLKALTEGFKLGKRNQETTIEEAVEKGVRAVRRI